MEQKFKKNGGKDDVYVTDGTNAGGVSSQRNARGRPRKKYHTFTLEDVPLQPALQAGLEVTIDLGKISTLVGNKDTGQYNFYLDDGDAFCLSKEQYDELLGILNASE